MFGSKTTSLRLLLSVLVAACSTGSAGLAGNAGAEMDRIYRSLKVTNVRTAGGPYAPGDTVAVAYEIANTSDVDLKVPVDRSYSRPYHLIGTRQHWIERQGTESTIPAIGPRIARQGRKYAAGGSIIRTGPVVSVGERLYFTRKISTTGYPSGKYTYCIEYKQLGGGVIQTEKIDFELTAANSAAEEREEARVLEGEDVRVRTTAPAASGRKGSKAGHSTPELLKALQDRDPEVRRRAAYELKYLGRSLRTREEIDAVAKLVVPGLAKALKDSSHGVGWAAAEALASLGPAAKEAVPDLAKALQDPKSGTRRRAALALGRAGPAAKQAVPDLVKTLQDEDEEVRYEAAVALEAIGPAAIPVLEEMLRDECKQLRETAARTLERIRLSPE